VNIRGERLLKEREKIYRKSGSIPATLQQEMEAKDGSSKKKRKYNNFRKAIWGDPRTAAGQHRFKEFLKNLKNADSFLKDERGFVFFQKLPEGTRKKVYKKLREVDLKGYNTVLGRMRTNTRQRNTVKELAMDLVVKEDCVAVEKEIECGASPRLLKLMPMGGLKNILALAVAAGHTRDEVANMAQMTPAEFNALITPADVTAAAKDMPNAITFLANGIVLRDLMAGNVTNNTKEADMIVARRSKVAVEVSKETRERTKFSDELEKKREDEMAKRFGVDRKKGEVIDASNQP
jgi:hypothetical protein